MAKSSVLTPSGLPFVHEEKQVSITSMGLEDIALGKSGHGITVSEKNALQVTAVLCAVRVIAEGLAQMPLRIRRRVQQNGRVLKPDAPDHSAWKLFNSNANTWMTSFQFIEYAVMISALAGDFLGFKVRDGNNRIREILPMVPHSWSVQQKPNSYDLQYNVTLQTGQVMLLEQADVFHLRGVSWNTYQGLRPVQLAAQSLGLSRALESHQASLARSGGRPSGVLHISTPINPEQKEAIRKSWQDRFGAGGDGGIAVLDGGGSFSPMSMTSVDAEHLDTRKFQIEEIARLFRVFPQMLMQTDKASTFASAEQFFRAHVIHTLGPWMRRFEAAVNTQIIDRDFPTVFSDFDERQMLRGDFSDQAEYYAKALGSGGSPAWMTQNDVREETGLDPVNDPNADKLASLMQGKETDNAGI